MKFNKFFIVLFTASLGLLLAACGSDSEAVADNVLSASGVISAKDLNVSPEMSGKVVEISVNEGDWVEEGDLLFRLDDEIIAAQYQQARAAVTVAESTVNAAQAQLAAAEIQYQLAVQGVRAQDQEFRAGVWQAPQVNEIELPVWYFMKTENIAALEVEAEDAAEELEIYNADLADLLADISNDDFVSAEEELAAAQASLSIAAYTLQQASQALDRDDLVDVAQDSYDSALADLESAQLTYDRLLNTSSAEEVLEARAKVAVAQARYDNAMDALLAYQTGDQSLQLQAAEAGVTQAETAVSQAQAGLAQAQAALAVLEISMKKTTVTAPVSGVILSRNLEKGELIAAGSIVMTIGILDEVSLTVYIPEDTYGRVSIGQEAIVTVDSFPNKTYTGKVSSIADQAEFTPRNVQTTEERKTTVFAVKVTLKNPNLDLKPGMPADVDIYTNN
ncbi:MAG: efflux RND transporter periplasmic adaptor subunit [Anaerolineales bacterium]|nr:efflux RND transporter periplasmic adaptor subunit [Anaerolineales bacterium]